MPEFRRITDISIFQIAPTVPFWECVTRIGSRMVALDAGYGLQDFYLSALRAVSGSSVRRNPDKQKRSESFPTPYGSFRKKM